MTSLRQTKRPHGQVALCVDFQSLMYGGQGLCDRQVKPERACRRLGLRKHVGRLSGRCCEERDRGGHNHDLGKQLEVGLRFSFDDGR